MQVHVGEQRRSHGSLRRTQLRLRPLAVFRYSRLQPFPDQAKYPAIGHPMLDELHRPGVAQVIEEATDVGIEHPVRRFRWMATVNASSAWCGLRPGRNP